MSARPRFGSPAAVCPDCGTRLAWRGGADYCIACSSPKESTPPVTAPLPTATYRAIRTRFVGPTNSRGSGVIADAGDRASRIVLDWDSALNSERNHATAALAVVDKMGWNTEYHTPITGGGYGAEYFWVFLPKAAQS